MYTIYIPENASYVMTQDLKHDELAAHWRWMERHHRDFVVFIKPCRHIWAVYTVTIYRINK